MGMAVVDVGTLARNWWALLIRGLAGALFGLLTFMVPGISLVALVLLFGAYSFADGIFAMVMAVRRRGSTEPWWMMELHGVVGLTAAAVTWFYPGLTAFALLYLVAAWAIVTGILEIVAAIHLRKTITAEWLLVLSGIASVAVGVVLSLFPGPGALALVLWIGGYALVSGALLIGLSFKLRSWAKRHALERFDVGHPSHRPASV
jgi:uncharacterized membrane protein HdeD (DUF308 family)